MGSDIHEFQYFVNKFQVWLKSSKVTSPSRTSIYYQLHTQIIKALKQLLSHTDNDIIVQTVHNIHCLSSHEYLNTHAEIQHCCQPVSPLTRQTAATARSGHCLPAVGGDTQPVSKTFTLWGLYTITTCCSVALPNRQIVDTAKNKTVNYLLEFSDTPLCFKATEESCKLHDNVFDMG
jgi:hypothetical protein